MKVMLHWTQGERLKTQYKQIMFSKLQNPGRNREIIIYRGLKTMDKRTVIAFNQAYATEPAERELQFVNDLLTVWGKLEPNAGKNPSIYRRGVLFGMALQKGIDAGIISLPEAKPKRKNKATTNQQEPGNE